MAESVYKRPGHSQALPPVVLSMVVAVLRFCRYYVEPLSQVCRSMKTIMGVGVLWLRGDESSMHSSSPQVSSFKNFNRSEIALIPGVPSSWISR